MERKEDATLEVDREDAGQFQIGQAVYVFDENNYDRYEGVIQQIRGDGILIHYSKLQDDDGWVSIKQVIPVTPENTAIFEQQEQMRKGIQRNQTKEEDSSETQALPKKRKRRYNKEVQHSDRKSSNQEDEVLVSTHGLSRTFVLALDQEVREHRKKVTLEQVDDMIEQVAETFEEHSEEE
jgi:hypothetical protein